ALRSEAADHRERAISGLLRDETEPLVKATGRGTAVDAEADPGVTPLTRPGADRPDQLGPEAVSTDSGLPRDAELRHVIAHPPVSGRVLRKPPDPACADRPALDLPDHPEITGTKTELLDVAAELRLIEQGSRRSRFPVGHEQRLVQHV